LADDHQTDLGLGTGAALRLAGEPGCSGTLLDFPSVPVTAVGTSRDTEVEAFIDGGAMPDPMTSLRDSTNVLGAALTLWADRDTAQDKAAAKRAGRTAVDAIDALLRDLYLLRGSLVREIRHASGAPPGQVA
jgi:hypothetical protein